MAGMDLLARAQEMRNRPVKLDRSLFEDIDFTEVPLTVESANGIAIRLFRVDCSAPGGAAVINLHGGGFIRPRGERDRLYSAFLSAHLGATVFDVDYSISPEHPFPQAYEDALAALRFVSCNASSLGIDPSRIALCGHSAGGNLAIGAAIAGGVPVKALLAEYSVLDFATPARDKVRDGNEAMLERAKIEEEFYTFYTDRTHYSDPRVSPLYHSADELKKLPETLIITAGGIDTLTCENIRFYTRLVDAGVDAHLSTYSESAHSFTISRTGEWKAALEEHLAFFRRTLA